MEAPKRRLTPPFSRPPAGATVAHASGVTAEWGGCNGMLGVARLFGKWANERTYCQRKGNREHKEQNPFRWTWEMWTDHNPRKSQEPNGQGEDERFNNSVREALWRLMVHHKGEPQQKAQRWRREVEP